MKTIIVDDELRSMETMKRECSAIDYIELVGEFSSPIDAIEYARLNLVEFALLDVDMPEMNGFELADKLREIKHDMIIVFVTAHAGYAVEAIRKKADYIVFKPYDTEDVMDVVERVKALRVRLQKRTSVSTFGRFDAFIDGQAVNFKSAKAKELFALCVYRKGAMVAAEEIIDKLWPEYIGTVGDCSIFRFTVKQLSDTLKEHNAGQIFGRCRGSCYVNRDMIDCDYYRFLDGDEEAVCDFQGEFMSDYAWGETTIYSLQEKKLLHKKREYIKMKNQKG